MTSRFRSRRPVERRRGRAAVGRLFWIVMASATAIGSACMPGSELSAGSDLTAGSDLSAGSDLTAGSEQSAGSPHTSTPKYTREERDHWSFRPRARAPVPQFSDRDAEHWIRNPIDAFVLDKQRAAGLQPAAEADRLVLVRRLYLHLTGLPPAPEDVDQFLADSRPDAYEQLVDRILSSPHFGEQWGQHWLDVVRFAESEGFEYDRHRAGAWRYRDYVIDSLNADTPYDRFVREQLAGDEFDRPDEAALVAAGFHRLGPVRRNAGNTDVAFSRHEVLTELTDAIGFVYLGMTLGCARCHDHMFDAVKQRDYFQMQSFLAATHEHDERLGPSETVAAWNKLNTEVQAEITRLREALNDAAGDERDKLVAELRAVEKRAPSPLPTISTVREDSQRRTPIHILERGQTDLPREQVSPRFLGVLIPDDDAGFPPNLTHPKTVLAQWITDPEHPLTARVIVNRLWHHHFGRGLVATPNDLGANGSPPSHPELLDFLANQLIANGWQLKPLHRLIVTSSVYRQASAGRAEQAAREIDPNNRLLWRFNRRRMSAEQLRDSLLYVSGRLNERFGGPSVIPPVGQDLVDLLYAPEQWSVTEDLREHDRRSIYLVAKRNLRLPYLEVFDQPDLQISCSRRESSTHAPQALELLNGELANGLAKAFAEQARRAAGDEPDRLVDWSFREVLGRGPTPAEAASSRVFLAQQPLTEFALVLFNLNAFLYIE